MKWPAFMPTSEGTIRMGDQNMDRYFEREFTAEEGTAAIARLEKLNALVTSRREESAVVREEPPQPSR